MSHCNLMLTVIVTQIFFNYHCKNCIIWKYNYKTKQPIIPIVQSYKHTYHSLSLHIYKYIFSNNDININTNNNNNNYNNNKNDQKIHNLQIKYQYYPNKFINFFRICVVFVVIMGTVSEYGQIWYYWNDWLLWESILRAIIGGPVWLNLFVLPGMLCGYMAVINISYCALMLEKYFQQYYYNYNIIFKVNNTNYNTHNMQVIPLIFHHTHTHTYTFTHTHTHTHTNITHISYNHT